MPNVTVKRDLSFKWGRDAMRLMQTHAPTSAPQTYALFYAFAAGQDKALCRAVSDALSAENELSEQTIQSLYDRYLSTDRFAEAAEKTGDALVDELDGLIALIAAAMGSTGDYARSLVSISSDLDQSTDADRLKRLVHRLVAATQQTIETNKVLEDRLREKRTEVQDLRETLEAIRTETLTDVLTTLANRKHLDGILPRSVDHAALSGESLSVLMIDVDHFKAFNDTWGHLTGDQVLRLVAMSIKGEVRPTDTAARFGGEEFVIVLPQTALDAAYDIAERVRQTVMGRELVKRSTGEALGRLTVSIGVATLQTGDTATLLLERADRCLLEAKRIGRNRTVSQTMFDPEEPVATGAALSDVA